MYMLQQCYLYFLDTPQIKLKIRKQCIFYFRYPIQLYFGLAIFWLQMAHVHRDMTIVREQRRPRM